MMKTEAHSTVRISHGDRRMVEGLFIAGPFCLFPSKRCHNIVITT
jgi:hypothetical protein